MNSCPPAGATAAEVDTRHATPFTTALALTPAGPGVYHAELSPGWTVGGGKLHGGLMMALLTRAGLTALDVGLVERDGAGGAEPLAVSAEFLRAPDAGAAELRTDVVKVGRTASVVRVELHQEGRLALSGTVTAGRLPERAPDWTDLPALPAEPPAGALTTADAPGAVAPLSRSARVVLDPATTGFLRGEVGEPTIRGWVRPVGEEPDPLFAVFAGDVLPPVLFNLGRPGWTPTVQLTALVRGRPAPGWLRLEASTRTVRGTWFDEDYTVIDSAGRLVCQARQLALAPLAR
jgi:acyl-coenzyme A thioesterase PaaI-like protein